MEPDFVDIGTRFLYLLNWLEQMRALKQWEEDEDGRESLYRARGDAEDWR